MTDETGVQAVTVERYIAVCRPHQYRQVLTQIHSVVMTVSRTISQTMSNTKRLLVYIVPVTFISFALNIPKVRVLNSLTDLLLCIILV